MDRSQRTEDRSQRTEDRSQTSDLRLTNSVFAVRHPVNCILLLLFLSLSSGCGNKFFDPTQVGRFRPVPAVNIILDSLGVAEETPVAWEQAQEPLPIDTMAVETDYVFTAGDIISIAIFELLQEGVQFVNNYNVTETGKISIPEVGVIEAVGLTEMQLEEQIRQILTPGILKDPLVVVTLAGSQQHAFSILGDGVPLPGRYPIPRYNFRLTDALATAGGPRQFNVSYIYVSRFVGNNKETGHEPLKPGFDEFELKAIEPETARPSRKMQTRRAGVPPRAQYQWPQSNVVISSSEMVTDWEAAGMPKAFEWPSSRDLSQMDTQTGRKSSTGLTAPPSMDEPVGTKDILNTLEKRRREQLWLNGHVNVENAMDSFRVLAYSEKSPTFQSFSGGARMDERINRRDTQALFSAPAAPERIDEPVSVKDILKTLDQRSRDEQKWLNQRVDVENARESFPELVRSEKRLDEWVNHRDALASSAPIAPKLMNEPLANEQLAKEEPGGIKWIFQNGKWISVPGPVPVPVKNVSTKPKEEKEKEQEGHIEWTFQNGKWVPVQVGLPKQPIPLEPIEPVGPVIKIEPGERPIGPFEKMPLPDLEPGPRDRARLIRIPADKLLAGESRYNIMIKPGDTIHVPVDLVGEFCIMGNVNRTGYIPLTGRPMTFKMAIAAAGGLGPLAWPKRCEVVRRIGREKEEIAMVDLDKIFSGEQPDFFIKPNDFINVGTHPTSRWRAVLRNAFRASYGFGFVYDRNFAYRDYWGTTYNSVTPWKWDSVW